MSESEILYFLVGLFGGFSAVASYLAILYAKDPKFRNALNKYTGGE